MTRALGQPGSSSGSGGSNASSCPDGSDRSDISSTAEGSSSSSCGSSDGSRNSATSCLAGDGDIGSSLASLAASATKVSKLVVGLAAGDGAVAVAPEADLCFLNVAWLVWQGISRGNNLTHGDNSQLVGALLPLLEPILQLHLHSTRVPLELRQALALTAGPQGGPGVFRLEKISILNQLLAKLDAWQGSAGLGIQERLALPLCQTVNSMVDSALGEAAVPGLGNFLGLAAKHVARSAGLWHRSASLVVQGGLLESMAAWAAALARRKARGKAEQHSRYLELQQIWEMTCAVAHALLRQLEPGGAAVEEQAGPVRELLHSVQALPGAGQRQKTMSPGFWDELVLRQLLPGLQALASVAAARALEQDPAKRAVQLRVARALVTRVCANPACLNLRGCSEARLRSRRCSGCCVARYCSCECQAADLAVHARVCRKLRADAAAACNPPA